MITVTDRAADVLQEMLTQRKAEPSQGVKLAPSGEDQIGLSIATPDTEDAVLMRGTTPLLIVDSRIKDALARMEMDCETKLVEGRERTIFQLRAQE